MAAVEAVSGGGGAHRPVYSSGYKSTVLSLLVIAYTLNFLDRTIIGTIGQAIKEDLRISDTQLGLLGGLYFALLYTLLGIPIARLAERFNRVSIISTAILIWSGFTALCGTATSFAQLALYRFGVGFGEAGLSPPAHSLISDYYEPRKRATALAVYAFGIPMGTMLGAVIGGYLTQYFSWRAAFMLVGVPGIAMAIALKLVVKEPPRGHSEPQPHPALPDDVVAEPKGTAEPFSLAHEFREMAAVARVLFLKWPVANMVLGVTLISFGGYGMTAFTAPYFIRTFGLDYAQVGLLTGLVGGFSAGVGTLLGGVVTDRLAAFSPRWYSLTPAIGAVIAAPLYMVAYVQPSWQVAAAILLIPGIFLYIYLGPTFGVVQNMFDIRRRATATALLFFFLNLFALGGGPPFTGLMIDLFAQHAFTHPGDPGLSAALPNLFGQAAGPIDFGALCPGGRPAPGAAAELAGRCHDALAHGTRHGLLITFGFFLWGALHYFLGAFGLTEALAKARAERGEAA